MAIIVAPPGAGKSYWLRAHRNSGWEEGDDLYPDELRGKARDLDTLKRLEDLNNELKARGKRILTSDWYELRGADAVVLPPEDEVTMRLLGEERPGNIVAESFRLLREWSEKKGVPVYASFDAAIAALGAGRSVREDFDATFRVSVVGEEGSGRAQLIGRAATGIFQALPGRTSFNATVDGAVIRLDVRVDEKVDPKADVALIVYDVDNTQSPNIVDGYVLTLERLGVPGIVVGAKMDIGVHDVAQRARTITRVVTSLDKTISRKVWHFTASALTGMNIEALVRALAWRASGGGRYGSYADLETAARITPRERTPIRDMAWIQNLPREPSLSERDAILALSEDDVTAAIFAYKRGNLSKALYDTMLVWLPKPPANFGNAKKRGELLTLIRARDAAGAVFFHGPSAGASRYAEAGQWLTARGYGLLPSARSAEEFDRAVATELVDSLEYAGSRVLTPWEKFDARRSEIRGATAMASLRLRTISDAIGDVARPLRYTGPFTPVWAVADGMISALGTESYVADFSGVPVLTGIPAGRNYNIQDAKALGQGAFGCVLRIPRTGGSDVAIKVQAASKMTRIEAKHEIAIQQLVQRQAFELGRATPYVARIYDGYITEKLPKLEPPPLPPTRPKRAGRTKMMIGVPVDAPEPDTAAAEDLARAVAKACADVDVKALAGGIVVTETPVAEYGELRSPRLEAVVDESQRRAWAFQLVHGLAAMQKTSGFVHMDIKPANVLVFGGESSPYTPERRVRVRTRDGRDVVVTDTSPTVAVLADYGLAFASHVPSLGQKGPFFESLDYAELHTAGTYPFLDPTLGIFYDPDSTLPFGGFSARGIAGDVWALGLTLLNVWMREGTTAATPDGARVRWNPRSVLNVAGILPGIRPLSQQVLLFAKVTNRRAGTDFIGSERPRGKGWSYMTTLMHSILLNRAFNGGEWPSTPALPGRGPGPYWQYISENGFEVVTKALDKGDTPYDIIARRLKATHPNVHDFVRRCLDWNPETRAKFLMHGEAHTHDLFMERTSHLVFSDPTEVSAEGSYVLDLSQPIAAHVREEGAPIVVPPGTPTQGGTEPAPPAPQPQPQPQPQPEPEPEPESQPEPVPEPVPVPEPTPPPSTPGGACVRPEVKEIAVPAKSPAAVIDMLLKDENAEDVYVFDFKDTLVARSNDVTAALGGGSNTWVRALNRKIRDKTVNGIALLEKTGSDASSYYGPPNLKDLRKFEARVHILVDAEIAIDEAAEVLAGKVGTMGDVLISVKNTNAAAIVRSILAQKKADTVHYIDANARTRESIRKDVSGGARVIQLYDVNMLATVRDATR